MWYTAVYLKMPKGRAGCVFHKSPASMLLLRGTQPPPPFPLLSPSLAMHHLFELCKWNTKSRLFQKSTVQKGESNGLMWLRDPYDPISCAQEGGDSHTCRRMARTCFLKVYLVWAKSLRGEFKWLTSLVHKPKEESPLSLYILLNVAWFFKRKYYCIK